MYLKYFMHSKDGVHILYACPALFQIRNGSYMIMVYCLTNLFSFACLLMPVIKSNITIHSLSPLVWFQFKTYSFGVDCAHLWSVQFDFLWFSLSSSLFNIFLVLADHFPSTKILKKSYRHSHYFAYRSLAND